MLDEVFSIIETGVTRYREISPQRRDEFLAKGYKLRHVFPHQLYYLPKCGPDGFQLAQSMCGPCRLDELSEIVLYAHPSHVAEFPQELFFDDDLVWHQQQFAKVGQVATANLVLKGTSLYSMVHQSDLVQRAARQPQYRSRIQNRFKGWNFMLLNAILNFAIEQQVQTVYTPTANLALRNTDPARNAARALFERIYDIQVQQLFDVGQAGEWWAINVGANRDRIVVPEKKTDPVPNPKTVCLCHDVEHGLGHLESDPAFAIAAETTSPQSLADMLRIEKQMDIKATYNVVGQLVPDLRTAIEGGGHCLAFHSYDHQNLDDSEQLPRCRSVDYRLKGYRPPQSKITKELSDENLCFHNFEWLASSSHSLGIAAPVMHNRLVKIPIDFDDYDLYRKNTSWETWEERALQEITQHDFIAFSLHDCYAPFWLPHYARFLEKLCSLGKLRTMNEVMNGVLLSHAF